MNNKAEYHWEDANLNSSIPSNAYFGGIDIDGQQIYVGRAYHEKHLLPANVIPGKNATYVSFNGGVYLKNQYQVLCVDKYRLYWTRSVLQRIPHGAVEGGKTESGETLYIGRVNHQKCHTLGKVYPSNGNCLIPFEGKELSFGGCEVLVI